MGACSRPDGCMVWWGAGGGMGSRAQRTGAMQARQRPPLPPAPTSMLFCTDSNTWVALGMSLSLRSRMNSHTCVADRGHSARCSVQWQAQPRRQHFAALRSQCRSTQHGAALLAGDALRRPSSRRTRASGSQEHSMMRMSYMEGSSSGGKCTLAPEGCRGGGWGKAEGRGGGIVRAKVRVGAMHVGLAQCAWPVSMPPCPTPPPNTAHPGSPGSSW